MNPTLRRFGIIYSDLTVIARDEAIQGKSSCNVWIASPTSRLAMTKKGPRSPRVIQSEAKYSPPRVIQSEAKPKRRNLCSQNFLLRKKIP